MGCVEEKKQDIIAKYVLWVTWIVWKGCFFVQLNLYVAGVFVFMPLWASLGLCKFVFFFEKELLKAYEVHA